MYWYDLLPRYIEGWTWKITDSATFGILILILTFSLSISFVPLIPAKLSVSTLPCASNWSRMFLSTNESVNPVSQIAIVSMEVVPLEKTIGTICKLLLREFAVKTASALLGVSILLFCFVCISGWLSSLCRNPLWRLLQPSLPQVRLALHWLILWPVLRQEKHRLHFFTVSRRSASFIFLNFSHSLILCSPSFRGHCVLVAELESLTAAKLVVLVLSLGKLILALSRVKPNCNLMFSSTCEILFLSHALNFLIFLWLASYLCKNVNHLLLRLFGNFLTAPFNTYSEPMSIS